MESFYRHKIEGESHCIGNSPRFVIELDVDGDGATEKRVMAYFPPLPNSMVCYDGWVNSGNFMDFDSSKQRFDTSDFDSGSINNTYAEALSIVGDCPVVDILLIVDGEIINQSQAILVDNVIVDNFRLNAKGFSKKPADVEPSDWSYDYVEKLYSAGITTGCDNYNYCPNDNVTRAEMAVFILKAIYGSGFSPAKAHHHFTDVPEDYWAEDWLETLYWDGITNGCHISPAMYCPESPLSRAEMAIFLLKAKHGNDYLPPAASGMFIDVPVDHWAASWIEQLYEEGITTGCSSGPLRYCPEGSLTWQQMAAFLVRTFDLR